MSIYNVNLFATDAAQISLTEDELEASYKKLQRRLRHYQTIKNTENPAFLAGIRWGIPALAALFVAAFLIPALQTKNESPFTAPVEIVRYTNSLRNSVVIVDGDINNSKLSLLLAGIYGFSSEDKSHAEEALPYLPEIDVFKPNFPDHGIHLLNFSNTLIQTAPQSIPTQVTYIPAELQLLAVTGSGM
jgi:hypothetical protein